MKATNARLWSNPKLRLALSLVFGGICLYLALRGVNFSEVFYTLQQADSRYVCLAFGITIVNIVLKIWRWGVLLNPVEPKVETGKLSAAFLSAQLLNSIFPIRVGEISRIVVIGGDNAQHGFVLGTVVSEKLLDMLAFALLLFALMIWVPLPTWLGQATTVYLGLTIIIFMTLFFIILFHKPLLVGLEKLLGRFSERTRGFLLKNSRAVFSSLETLQQPSEIARLALLTVSIWMTAVLTNQVVFWALDISAPAVGSLLILMAAQTGLTLPALPGKIGIFEYACVLAMQFLGFSREVGLSYGILLHIVIYLPILVSGLVSLFYLQMKGLSISSSKLPMA